MSRSILNFTRLGNASANLLRLFLLVDIDCWLGWADADLTPLLDPQVSYANQALPDDHKALVFRVS